MTNIKPLVIILIALFFGLLVFAFYQQNQLNKLQQAMMGPKNVIVQGVPAATDASSTETINPFDSAPSEASAASFIDVFGSVQSVSGSKIVLKASQGETLTYTISDSANLYMRQKMTDEQYQQALADYQKKLQAFNEQNTYKTEAEFNAAKDSLPTIPQIPLQSVLASKSSISELALKVGDIIRLTYSSDNPSVATDIIKE